MGYFNKRLFHVFLIILLTISSSSGTVLYSEEFYLEDPQDRIVIPVHVFNASNLYAFKFDLISSNAGLLEYSNLTEGGFLTSDGQEIISSVDLGILNYSAGELINVLISRKTTYAGVSGSGTLVLLTFDIIGEGSSQLTLSDVELSDPESNSMDYDVYYLNIWDDSDINPVPNGEVIKFYASFKNRSGSIVAAECVFIVDDNSYQMELLGDNYVGELLYQGTEEHQWTAVCDQDFQKVDTFVLQPVSQPSDDGGLGGSSGGGAGGSSGGGLFQNCVSSFACEAWMPVECPDSGIQTRECNDQNNCARPRIETQSCSPKPQNAITENIQEESPDLICGDGVIQPGERSDTCCEDVGCTEGFTCTFHTCMKDIESKAARISIWVVLGIAAFLSVLLFVGVLRTNRYYKQKKIKAQPQFAEYVGKLKEYMFNQEVAGANEKELEEKLRETGWDETYIKEAEKGVKQRKKLLDKVRKE